MEWYYIVLIVLGSIVVLVSILFPFILSYLLYSIHMVRTSKNKWNRKCSALDNEEQVKMWNEGLKYIESLDLKSDIVLNIQLWRDLTNE